MSISWHFNEAGPGDRARESQVEKFRKYVLESRPLWND
jgi:hypothetical protein